VRAGPGSGKTRHAGGAGLGLMEEGVKPKQILMITFTRKAAGELRERLSAQGRKAGNIRVSTFHALGRKIIAEAGGGSPPSYQMSSAPRLSRSWLRPGDISRAGWIF
jgi:superfamily I DNA/RNA helicase